jgi:hypothetical protein
VTAPGPPSRLPPGQKVLVDAQSGDLVVTALEHRHAGTVSPKIEGRIAITP